MDPKIIAAFGLLCLCSISSSIAASMGGGEEDPGGGGGGEGGGGDGSDASGPTFDPPVVPTDEASTGQCYLSRYTDMRLAYRGDATKALTNSANRDVSCEISDEEAQCYLDRYSDARTYAGSDLNGARTHYYTVGQALGYDFVCPPGKKEIGCYMGNNPDMAAGLSAGGWGVEYNAFQHWNNTGKEAGLSYTCA